MVRRDGVRRLRKLLDVLGLWSLALTTACSSAPVEPVQEVNAPPEAMVTSTPFDPFHSPREGTTPPDVVVEINLENRYDFDLLPTRVNGAPVQFNRDHRDNDEEPLKLPPGKVRFVLTNTGTISHNFRLMGTTPEGVTFDVTTPAVERFMGAGVMWEMEARLWEGEYRMICNVTNHEARGMSRPLIVSGEVSYPAPPLP